MISVPIQFVDMCSYAVAGETMRIKSLKEGIVPHKFPWSSASPISKRERNDRMEARKLRKIDEFKYSFRDVPSAVQEIPFVENKGKNIVIHFHWKYSFALLEREKSSTHFFVTCIY